MIAQIVSDPNITNLNPGGLATGGGMIALAIAAGPIILKILDWIEKQKDKQRQWDKDQKKDDVEAQTRLISIIKEMATETAKHSAGLDSMQEDLRWLMDYIRRRDGNSSLSLPPSPPTLPPH